MAEEVEATMSDLLTGFGIEDPPPEQEEEKTGEIEEPTSTEEDPKEPASESESEEKEVEEPKPDTTEDTAKLNKAFAEMRVKNKEYEKLLTSIAETVGVKDVTDPNQLVSALRQTVINAQAKQQNIDPKILARLHDLENRDQLNQREQIHRAALSGFQKVKNDFGLDDKGLQKFADQLVAEGMNPFEQRLDLPMLYISRNYTQMLEKARAEGAAAEADRLSKADRHSTTPNDRVGGEEETPSKINSVAELERWAAQK